MMVDQTLPMINQTRPVADQYTEVRNLADKLSILISASVICLQYYVCYLNHLMILIFLYFMLAIEHECTFNWHISITFLTAGQERYRTITPS